jgi:hypothetical protein
MGRRKNDPAAVKAALITRNGVILAAIIAALVAVVGIVVQSLSSALDKPAQAPITISNTTGTTTAFVGNNVTVTVNPPLDEEALATRLNQLMKREEDQKKKELEERYPLGYAIFTITDRNVVLPFKSTWGHALPIDWNSAAVYWEKGILVFRYPTMELPNGSGLLSGHRSTVPAKPGQIIKFDFHPVSLRLENIRSMNEGLMFVLGISPLNRR